jgi:hypothetical protein
MLTMLRQTPMMKCGACRSGQPLKIAFRHEGRRVRSAAFSIATLLVSINIAVVDRAARVLS